MIQLLFIIFFNQIDPSALYTIMEQNQQVILKTFHRITPERIVIHYSDGTQKTIENQKKEATFKLTGDIERIQPIFALKTSGDLLKLIEKYPREVWPEKIVNVLTSRELLTLYQRGKVSEVDPLNLLEKRSITLKDLEGIQFTQAQRMEVVNILSREGVIRLKHAPYYLLPLIYSEHQQVFSRKDQRYLLRALRSGLKQRNSAVVKGIFSLNLTPFYFFRGILFAPEIPMAEKRFLLEAINLSDNPIEDSARFYPKYIRSLKTFDAKLLKKISYHLPVMIQHFPRHIQTIVEALPRYLQLPFMEGIIDQMQTRLSTGTINYLLRERWEGYLWVLLKYLQGRRIDHPIARKRVKDYLSNEGEGPFYQKILYQSFFYADDQLIFDQIVMKTPVLTALYDYLISRDLRYKTAIDYAYKKGFDPYEPASLRLLMGLYIIRKDQRFSSQPFFDYIQKIHRKKKLEFKEDEHYVQTILPMVAGRYQKRDYEEYIILLETRNRAMIQTVLRSISITGDSRFIPPLERLTKELKSDPGVLRQVNQTINVLKQQVK